MWTTIFPIYINIENPHSYLLVPINTQKSLKDLNFYHHSVTLTSSKNIPSWYWILHTIHTNSNMQWLQRKILQDRSRTVPNQFRSLELCSQFFGKNWTVSIVLWKELITWHSSWRRTISSLQFERSKIALRLTEKEVRVLMMQADYYRVKYELTIKAKIIVMVKFINKMLQSCKNMI